MASIVNSATGKVISHIYFGVRGTLTVNNYYGPTLGALLGQTNFAYTFMPKTTVIISASAKVGEFEVGKVYGEKVFTQTKSSATWDVDLRQELSTSDIEHLVLTSTKFTNPSFVLIGAGSVMTTAEMVSSIGNNQWVTAYSKMQTKDLTPISLTLTSTGFGQSAGDIPLGKLYGVDWTLVEVKTPNNADPKICLSMSDIGEKIPSGATITVKKVTARISGDYEFTFVPSPRITSYFDITNYKVHLNAGDSFIADTNLVDQHVKPKPITLNVIFTLKSNIPNDRVSVVFGWQGNSETFTLTSGANGLENALIRTITVTVDKDGKTSPYNIYYTNVGGGAGSTAYLTRTFDWVNLATTGVKEIRVDYEIVRSEDQITEQRIKSGDVPSYAKDVTINVLSKDGAPVQNAIVIMSVYDGAKEVQHIEKLTDSSGNAKIGLSFKSISEPRTIRLIVKLPGGYVVGYQQLYSWKEVENKTYKVTVNYDIKTLNDYVKWHVGDSGVSGSGGEQIVYALSNSTMSSDPFAYLSTPSLTVIDDYSKAGLSGFTVQIYGPWKDLGNKYDTKTFTTDYLGRVNPDRSLTFDVNHEYKITISRSGYKNITVNVRFDRGWDDKTFSLTALNYIEKKEIEEQNKASVTIQHNDGSKETLTGDKTDSIDSSNAIKTQDDVSKTAQTQIDTATKDTSPSTINSVLPTLTIEGIAMLSLSFIVTLAVLYIIITRREK
jgi:hypothetical protein